MTRKEERNDFIKSYLENYNGDSYEASAEREDIGTACNAAINWADKTMIEKACNWLKHNINYFCYISAHSGEAKINEFTLVEEFEKAMDE